MAEGVLATSMKYCCTSEQPETAVVQFIEYFVKKCSIPSGNLRGPYYTRKSNPVTFFSFFFVQLTKCFLQ